MATIDTLSDVEPFPVSETDDASTPPEIPLKGKGRKRLLRGIQRISSSPSLTSLRRPRAASAPYSNRSALSCVSLAATGPPSSAFTSGTASPSPLGRPGTAHAGSSSEVEDVEPPDGEGSENPPARRAIQATASSQRTAPLPADFRPRARAVSKLVPKKPFPFWAKLPHELRVAIFSYLLPKELVRASRTSRAFHKFCFDGQLWTSFDASEFYHRIPAESLTKIIVTAGPFVKDLNLRGCVQVEHYQRTEAIVKACKNLINATLEGCSNIQKATLHCLLRGNERLTNLNLTGLSAVTNTSCKIIADTCLQLQTLNVSWCRRVDAKGLKDVIRSCTMLRELRAGEVTGFDDMEMAAAVFETNTLERLVLCGCAELTDEAFKVMIHGLDPERDILTGIPIVPKRKLRHLDLSRCILLSDNGVKALGHLVPDLEGLQVSRCMDLTDLALEPILATTPRLTHLDLEDLNNITNSLLAEHLAKAPCAATLEHLSLSYCENVGDVGVLPLIQECVGLKSVDLDNTRISDLVLAEAAAMVTKRSTRTNDPNARPEQTLELVVFDCHNVTWTGVREVLFRNGQVQASAGQRTYPTQVIGLKCFYGYQMTVAEHHKRILRGEFASAGRLERKWAEYMQAAEEAEAGGAGYRRRRRRASRARVNLSEEDAELPMGRPRARTTGSCTIM